MRERLLRVFIAVLVLGTVVFCQACSSKAEETPEETEIISEVSESKDVTLAEAEPEEERPEEELDEAEPAEEDAEDEYVETDLEDSEGETEGNPFAGLSERDIAGYAYDRFNGNETTLFGYKASEGDYDPDMFPESFDLREYGVVTPVKDQTPWGTCWAFGTIAACETSILSEMDRTYEETGLDLSEKHLAYFARSYINDGSDQDSEGIHLEEGAVPYAGSFIYSSTSLLSSGIGVVNEADCPYVASDGTLDAASDWSVPDDIKFLQRYELEETFLLPETVLQDEDGNYLGLDQNAVYQIKEQLMLGRGVGISYLPDDDNLSFETFAQFNPNITGSTHSVCIVGWDDSFSSECFVTAPEGDGAWIVKNSWGEDWGNEGYFYLSYYDRTIRQMTTFDFNVEEAQNDYYMVDQYDYLQTSYSKCWFSDEPTGCANVFKAEEDERLRCVSFETVLPDTYVMYSVYLLDDSSDSPDSGEQVACEEIKVRYPGYHRVNIDADDIIIPEGAYYSVIIYQAVENEEGKAVYPVNCDAGDNKLSYDETVEEYGKSLTDEWSVGIVNPGESWLYVSEAGRWVDWSEVLDVIYEINPNKDYDNFPIKGYADPVK